MGDNIATSIYQGSASYGRFMAIVGAVIATILSMILIGGGFYFNKSVSNYSKNTSGTIIGKSCSPATKDSKPSCTYTVTYNDENGTKIENVTFTSQTDMPLQSQVLISYDPLNKTDIRLTSDNTKSVGYGMMFFGFLIIVFAWGWVWITRKYEFAASASGFSSAFNMFKSN